jgi:hypothetical protein
MVSISRMSARRTRPKPRTCRRRLCQVQQMKRWSQGELDECRKQVAFLLDQGWIVPSRASHAASVVFARKPDETWRFCQDYSGLNAIKQRSVEPLPHVDQLVDETRGARFFTKLDLASDPRKVAAVEEWATPTSCTNVRRFIGLANYYRTLPGRRAT